MATENTLEAISFEASADLSASQYCGVYLNSSGQVALAGEGASAIGILQDKPAAQGRACAVGVSGISKVKFGATLVAGDRFSFDSAGRAVSVGSGDDTSMGVIKQGGTVGTIGSAFIDKIGLT